MTWKQLRLRNRGYKERAKKVNGSAGWDNTISPTVLGQILKTTTCRFCKCGIFPSQRTIEHLTPIVRGGLHSVTNVVMACYRCNNEKDALTEQEYFLLKHNPEKLRTAVLRVNFILDRTRKLQINLSGKN